MCSTLIGHRGCVQIRRRQLRRFHCCYRKLHASGTFITAIIIGFIALLISSEFSQGILFGALDQAILGRSGRPDPVEHDPGSTSQSIDAQPFLNSEIERSEALVLLDDLRSLSKGADVIEEMDDSLCKIANITRNSDRSRSAMVERSLNCSRIAENNYRQMVKNMYKQPNKLTIQQIEITNSESLVVFSAIDLICDRFNCSKLTVFNMSGQSIQDFSVLNTWINLWTQLEVLDLSNTSLSSIQSIIQADSQSPIVMQNLTTLILDFNNISELNFDFILDQMPNLRHLSIVNNSIFNISLSESSRFKFDDQLETISLANNSINCDPKTKMWLMERFQASRFPEHEQIRCSAPERLIEMTWNQRISVLKTPICDDCDCKSIKRTAISVDCHNRNLTALPDILPLNTKILNLTSNHISSLEIPEDSKNWENVTYIYLANNLLSSFKPLDKQNSKFLGNLAALDVRGNKFQEFPTNIFEQFINLDQVHLSNNPWICDCDVTFGFQEWLQRQFQKVGDKEDILCGISGSEENGVRSYSLAPQALSGRVIYRLAKSELCPQDDDQEKPYDWLDVVNLLLSLAIILILSKVSLDYIYQRRTKQLPKFFKLNL